MLSDVRGRRLEELRRVLEPPEPVVAVVADDLAAALALVVVVGGRAVRSPTSADHRDRADCAERILLSPGRLELLALPSRLPKTLCRSMALWIGTIVCETACPVLRHELRIVLQFQVVLRPIHSRTAWWTTRLPSRRLPVGDDPRELFTWEDALACRAGLRRGRGRPRGIPCTRLRRLTRPLRLSLTPLAGAQCVRRFEIRVRSDPPRIPRAAVVRPARFAVAAFRSREVRDRERAMADGAFSRGSHER